MIDIEFLKKLQIEQKLWFKPNEKQKEFFKLTKEAKFILFSGGNRVGKTLTLSVASSCFLTGIYPKWWDGFRFKGPIDAWFGCTTERSLIDLKNKWFMGEGSTPPLIHKSLVVSSNAQKHIYHIKHTHGISTIGFKTYKQGRQEWQAKKLDFIGFDEEPPLEIYHEACLRTTKTSGKEQGMVCIAATSLYYSEFVIDFYERSINGKSISVAPGEIVNHKVYLIGGWNDVNHIDEEAKNLQISNMSYNEIEARTQGIPSRGGGKVYPVDEQSIVCDFFEIPENYLIIGGLDFGWTNNTACVLIAIDPETRKKFLFAEYYAKELTPEMHTSNLINNLLFSKYISWCPIMHDPAGSSKSLTDGKSPASLYNSLNMISGNNSVSTGIEKTRQEFLNGKLKIFKTCTNILCEIRNYHYKEGTGEVKKTKDHSIDAMRYAVMGENYAKNMETPTIISFKTY